MAKKVELPKLPRGMGTYSWTNPEQTIIMFKKVVGEGDNKKRLVVRGKTVKECNQKMAEAETKFKEECNKHYLSSPRNTALPCKVAIFNWMVTYKLPTMKGKSYDRLEDIYKSQFMASDFANKQVEQITDIDIQMWLNDLAKKYAESTIKKCYSFIKMFLDYYYLKQPYNNPIALVKIPKVDNIIKMDENNRPIDPNKEYEVLEDDEITKFMEEASKPLAPGIGGYQHGQFFIFVMWSFMRYGEALALQWKDIDFEHKGAYVYKNYSYVRDRSDDDLHQRKWQLYVAKTKDSVRYEYLCDNAINALLEYKKQKKNYIGNEDFIFTTSEGKPIANDYLNRTLKNILKRANCTNKVTIHGLRHTGISYFLRHNIDIVAVSRMAGHSSTDITSQIYYTITQEQYKAEIDKINNSL